MSRDSLARRQHEVLTDLLADRVPVGFDPTGFHWTARILLAKRTAAVRRACPELVELPAWSERFAEWARSHPRRGCAHRDVGAFVATIRDTDPQWARLHEVYAGARRVALVRLSGRRILLIGLGYRVWRLEGKRWM